MPLPTRFQPRTKLTRKAGPPTKIDCNTNVDHDELLLQSSESMIMVMGVTGTGKSFFINKLKPGSVAEGHRLESQTKTCTLVRVGIGASKIAVVDTPGFDDDEDSDPQTLAKITTFLTAQYRLGIALKGIIYLHRINDNRVPGSAKRYLEVFKQLCGDDILQNVALVTTMWDQVDTALGLDRDAQLQNGVWDDIISKGACVYQYKGSQAMAETIVGQLLSKSSVVLRVQHELSDDHRVLRCTSAGSLVSSRLARKMDEERKRITILNRQVSNVRAKTTGNKQKELARQLKVEREMLLRHINAMKRLESRIDKEIDVKIMEVIKEKASRGEKWKTPVQIFAAVVQTVTTVTTSLALPLAGVSL